MTQFLDNAPNAAKLMQSLRNTGYDNYAAICDIIDNSFDANADIIKVSVGNSTDGLLVSIADNGDGMSEQTLSEALKLGSMTDHTTDSLGKFGMGLITASISIGRRLVIITKREGEYLTGVQDLDDITEKNQFIKEIRKSNLTEIVSFDEKLGGAETGTLVLIQKVDNIKNSNISIFRSILIKRSAEIYRYFLNANKKIYVNATEVKASDPLELNDLESEVLLDETRDFDINRKDTPIRIRIVRLPKRSKSDPLNTQSLQTQGFYIMRNNRQIAAGDNLGKLFTKHNSTNRFRAELFFTSEADSVMGVRFTKDGTDGITDAIYGWIEAISTPQVNFIKQQSEAEGKKQKPPVDYTPTTRQIASKAVTLKKPRISDIPANEMPKQLQNVSQDAFTNVSFETESNTRLAPLFRFELGGDKMVIRFNDDHPFYDYISDISKTNPTLTSAINHLIYSASLALIDITSTEDRWSLQDDFLDKMSDNLRSLLS